MYVERNIVARSRNVYTSSTILTTWYHSSRKERYYGDLMSPATIKQAYIFKWSARKCYSIVT